MKALQVDHVGDPRTQIWDKCSGLLQDIEILGGRVLLGIYERPEKTKGGIILTDRTKGEDIYQGKVGLILKTGPLAFVDDDDHHWGGVVPAVGDWIAIRVGDSWQCIIGDQQCRMIDDIDARMILTTPDVVY